MARVALLLVSLAACLVLANGQLSSGQDMEQQMNQMYQQLSSTVSGQTQPSGASSASSALQRARSMIQPYMNRLMGGQSGGANMANLKAQMERLRSSELGRQLSPQLERLRSSDLGRQLSQRLSQFSPSSSGISSSSSISNSLPSMSARKKRDVNYDGDIQPTADQQQQQQYNNNLNQFQQQPARAQPTKQEVIAYNQNIEQQSNRLSAVIQSLRNNPYLPTREQTIQILTTVVTLLVMMLLGPAAGASAGLISAMVRQLVPVVVTYGVNYAADSSAMGSPIDASIAEVPLRPVAVQQSLYGQAL